MQFGSSRSRWTRRAAAFAFALSASELSAAAEPPPAPATPAAPPSKEACSLSHGRSQELRLDGKLIEARQELRVCSDAACPRVLQADCAGWLAQVEQGIPSIVVLAEAEGGEASGVRVFVDGQPFAAASGDGPVELDPGAHRFRFELDGYPAIEQTLVLRQDEKRRVIAVRFQREAVPPPPAHAAPPLPAPWPAAPPGEPRPRPVPVASYVLGGVALAAAGVGAYFGFSALSSYSERRDSCAPTCADSDVDEIKTQLLLADALGGVAIVSAGLATYFFVTRPSSEPQRPALRSERIRVSFTSNRVGFAFGGDF